MEGKRSGKKGLCHFCNKEKYLDHSVIATPEDAKLYCGECFKVLNVCFCDICDKELKCTDYENHLLVHQKKDLAKHISKLMIEYIFY